MCVGAFGDLALGSHLWWKWGHLMEGRGLPLRGEEATSWRGGASRVRGGPPLGGNENRWKSKIFAIYVCDHLSSNDHHGWYFLVRFNLKPVLDSWDPKLEVVNYLLTLPIQGPNGSKNKMGVEKLQNSLFKSRCFFYFWSLARGLSGKVTSH